MSSRRPISSLGGIRTLASLRVREANQERVGPGDWVDASEIRGLGVGTMVDQAKDLSKRYEEAAGEYLTTMQLRAKAESFRPPNSRDYRKNIRGYSYRTN